MLNSIVLGHEIIMFRGGGHADSNRNCDDRYLPYRDSPKHQTSRPDSDQRAEKDNPLKVHQRIARKQVLKPTAPEAAGNSSRLPYCTYLKRVQISVFQSNAPSDQSAVIFLLFVFASQT